MGAVDSFGLFAGSLEDLEAGEEHRFGLLVREADIGERAEEIESYPANGLNGSLSLRDLFGRGLAGSAVLGGV